MRSLRSFAKSDAKLRYSNIRKISDTRERENPRREIDRDTGLGSNGPTNSRYMGEGSKELKVLNIRDSIRDCNDSRELYKTSGIHKI